MITKKGDFICWTGEVKEKLFCGKIVKSMLVAAKEFDLEEIKQEFQRLTETAQFDWESFYPWLLYQGYAEVSTNREKFQWDKAAEAIRAGYIELANFVKSS